ncbi:MAG: hypothetical protein ACD_20C00086G0031 [uncultured bacterium]|nr:MAG: hypothetical protein ACD_20C00086G0031 [uncultured bacterium]
MAKKWIICGECKYFYDCKAGQSRMQNVDINSKVYPEIGCYEHEQYLLQISDRQMKLF